MNIFFYFFYFFLSGGFQDGVIAMGGKYQRHTIFGDIMPNLVLVSDTDEDFERKEQQKKNRAQL